MKRTVLLMASLAIIGCAWGQNLAKNEAKSLQAFAAQTAVDGTTNAQVLDFTPSNVANMPGVTIENGHVTAIKWDKKKLSGVLDLTNFPYLVSVDVSDNKLTGLVVNNAPALVSLNASKNRLASVTLEGVGQLEDLRLNKNRISEIELGAIPLIKRINLSANNLVALDVSNSANLVYLNVISNNL